MPFEMMRKSIVQMHEMKLQPEPFEMIRSGIKTIELRLYDEKRKKISAGDTIRFVCTQSAEKNLLVRAKELFVFDSFQELYQTLPLLECGYTPENVKSATAQDMEKYYSKQQQAQYGVVGIKIELIE